MLIDTHCHLDGFSDDEVIGVVERAESVGVIAIVNAGVTVESSSRCAELTGLSMKLFAGVGIHPMDLTQMIDEHVYERLRAIATSTDRVVLSLIHI